MKNIKMMMTLIACCLLIVYTIPAKAAEILTVTGSYEDSVLKVEGTAQTDMVAAVVMIYDKTETNLLAMKSVQVNNGTFSCDIDAGDFLAGTYQVKVADYEGGTYAQTSITISNAGANSGKTTATVTSPKTGDNQNIWYFMILGSGCAIAIAGEMIVRCSKRKSQ